MILHDLLNTTIGFEQLAALTAKPNKSLYRRLSPTGNPSMDNLAAIFQAARAVECRPDRAFGRGLNEPLRKLSKRKTLSSGATHGAQVAEKHGVVPERKPTKLSITALLLPI